MSYGYATLHDIGALLESKFGGHVSVTAGGGNDAAEQSGSWINLDSAETAKAIITYTTTLAENETLDLAANMEDADDNSGTNNADYGSAAAQVTVATGGTGGTTETGTFELDFNLREANAYGRLMWTPTMSASSADTADMTVTWVLSGQDEFPVTNRNN